MISTITTFGVKLVGFVHVRAPAVEKTWMSGGLLPTFAGPSDEYTVHTPEASRATRSPASSVPFQRTAASVPSNCSTVTRFEVVAWLFEIVRSMTFRAVLDPGAETTVVVVAVVMLAGTSPPGVLLLLVVKGIGTSTHDADTSISPVLPVTTRRTLEVVVRFIMLKRQ
jgi:hypothetical protein